VRHAKGKKKIAEEGEGRKGKEKAFK